MEQLIANITRLAMEEGPARTEMIMQLQKRYLQGLHLESLPLEQLEKIYQGFVVPQPRRQPRDRSVPATNIPPTPTPMPMDVDQLTQRIKTTAMLGQKRPLPAQSRPDDKAKQIKMDLQ